MDELAPAVLARLPLAEAVLLVWRHLADDAALQDLYDRHRGACYDKVLSFPTMVGLIADALLTHGGNACRTFQQARAAETLTTSLAAAYGKLRRLPIGLSMAFLSEGTRRLQALLPPVPAVELPASLSDLTPIVFDGKAIKRVAKRLTPLRTARGGVLGGRALVALNLHTGLAVAMHADADGEANDVRFVPELLPVVRQAVPGPRLFLGDRQFCDLLQAAHFAGDDDHFLVRYHRRVTFTVDRARAARSGVDGAGRPYREEWGWLGRAAHKQRRYVRRITLQRAGEEDIIVVTSLLDADRYPAADLLAVYLLRWGIERVFQQVTEVFGLMHLIGSTPQATVFQFAFCLLLYNLIQVIRAYVAQAQQRPVETISTEKVFQDVTEQLIAWNQLVVAATTVALFAEALSAACLRQQLTTLLKKVWHDYWIKSPSRKQRPTPHTGGERTHGSAYRIIERHRQQQRRKPPSKDV